MNSNAEEVECGWISRFDRLGCRDVDKDGYSDPSDDWIAHPQGFADAFPNDASQWHDTDNDGFGDNMEYFDGQAWRLLTVVMDARPPMASRHLIDGAARISMKMAGLTPHRTGLPGPWYSGCLARRSNPMA